MGPKPSPIRVDRACARRLAAIRVVIGRFALLIGRSCRCWAVRAVISRALARTWLSCRPPRCRVVRPAVVSPTLLSCRPPCCRVATPCCRIACPVVGSPALLSLGPSGCRFTRPVLIRPFTLVAGFHLGVAVLSLCRGLRCVVVAILAVPLSPSWFHRCCCCSYIVVVVFLVAASSSWNVGVGKRGVKWGWWTTREGRKQATTKVVARFVTHRVGLPPSWVPPSGYSFPSALSSIEWAHIPQERGGAPVVLSSAVGSELGRRGGGGGGGRKGE